MTHTCTPEQCGRDGETCSARRQTRRQLRKWVRGWWADQMRKGTLPDVPEGFDDSLIEEVWTAESRRLADLLEELTL